MMMQHINQEVILNGVKFDKEYRVIRPSDNEVRWLY
jgi:hypothetical protein